MKYIKYLSICNCKSAKPMNIWGNLLDYKDIENLTCKGTSRNEQKKVK